MASTSGLLLPSAVRLPGTRLAGQAILPWALPLAGLSGTLLCIGRARPRCRSPASGPPTSTHSPPAIPIRSWACSTILPIPRVVRFRGELPPRHIPTRDCEVLSLREFVAALQRLDGADALFDLTQDHAAKLRPNPCLRFCTVRE
jgi:hypothetical protein